MRKIFVVPIFFMFVLIALFVPLVFAAEPVIFFSDLINGPDVGLGDGLGSGTIVTVWGYNLGNNQENSKIYFKDYTDTSREAAYVYYWGTANANGGPSDLHTNHKMYEIAFSIPDSDLGAGKIYVTVDGKNSNELDFTVQSGHIYFVNGDTNTGGLGTFNSPWTTPTSFISQISHGDIYYFRAGEYTGKYSDTTWGDANINLGSTHSGTNSAHVGFVSYPGEIVKFSGHQRAFWLKNSTDTAADYIVVSKLLLEPGSIAVHGAGWIESNEDGAKNFRVVGNKISVTYININSWEGMVSITNDDCVIYGNDFSQKNEQTEFYLNNHAIYIKTGADNAMVGWNTFHDMALGWVIQVHTDGASGFGMVFENFHIFNNYIISNVPLSCRGINTSGTVALGSYGFCYNNIVNSGYKGYGAIASYNGSCDIYNNTIYLSKPSTSVEGLIRIDGNMANRVVTVCNNVIYNTTSLSVPYIKANQAGLNDSNIYLKNNLYFGNGDGPIQDLSAVNNDPLFVNSINNDFTLQSNSQAIDNGVTILSLLKDFLGISRPQGLSYDIGAFEYVPKQASVQSDLNSDSKVDSADIQACVDHILGTQDWGTKADVNEDSKVDVIDAQLIINEVLKK